MDKSAVTREEGQTPKSTCLLCLQLELHDFWNLKTSAHRLLKCSLTVLGRYDALNADVVHFLTESDWRLDWCYLAMYFSPLNYISLHRPFSPS